MGERRAIRVQQCCVIGKEQVSEGEEKAGKK